jgi:hypothetical protein
VEQTSEQALEQQTPSTQEPEAHSPAAAQVWPAAFLQLPLASQAEAGALQAPSL